MNDLRQVLRKRDFDEAAGRVGHGSRRQSKLYATTVNNSFNFSASFLNLRIVF